MGESSMSDNKPYDAEVVRDGVTLAGSMASRWPKLVACGAGALLIVTGIAWGVARLVTPQVVTFDMKGTMDIFIQQSAQQKLDEARAKALVSRFNQAMIDSLAAWQQKHNAVILVQPAVVSVQPDITTAIRNDIAARMQSPAGEVK
ncbi:type-F conjugative transfer system protein TrbI (plasmid) [Kosakonia cowanii]|nr:type-F conjugative transfer system protein TrbI [Kosakonia cowanii]